MLKWLKRLWWRSPFHRHNWWYQTMHGVDVFTGKVIIDEHFWVCIVCRKKRPPSNMPTIA